VFDFGEKKKKKKKRSDLAEFEAQLLEEGGISMEAGDTTSGMAGEELDGASGLSDRFNGMSLGASAKDSEGPQDPWIGTTRDYTYEEVCNTF
jgi:hypothetical protein